MCTYTILHYYHMYLIKKPHLRKYFTCLGLTHICEHSQMPCRILSICQDDSLSAHHQDLVAPETHVGKHYFRARNNQTYAAQYDLSITFFVGHYWYSMWKVKNCYNIGTFFPSSKIWQVISCPFKILFGQVANLEGHSFLACCYFKTCYLQVFRLTTSH